MRLIKDPETLDPNLRGAAFAIGNFDGVHRGHQAVIGRTIASAAKTRAPVGVITFEPHPRRFFRPETQPFYLTPFPVKATLFENLGLDLLVALKFDRALAALSAEDFIKEILVRRLSCGHITIGHDFHFGRDRSGTPRILADWGATLGFAVEILEPVGDGETIYSSSRIREALIQARPREAASMMGHWWTIAGPVIHGDKRGRDLGYPTANVAMGEYLVPALGVYAVRVKVDGRTYEGAANLGRRPTFGDHDILLEAYLFDFAGDLYGREIAVALVEFLRPEVKFDTIDALKAQMAADCIKARAVLADPANAESRFALRNLRARTPS